MLKDSDICTVTRSGACVPMTHPLEVTKTPEPGGARVAPVASVLNVHVLPLSRLLPAPQECCSVSTTDENTEH